MGKLCIADPLGSSLYCHRVCHRVCRFEVLHTILGGQHATSTAAQHNGFPLQGPRVTAKLESEGGETVYASAEVKDISSAWTHPKIKLTSNGTDPNAQLTLYVHGAADISFRMVSVFPEENVKGDVLQPFRPDLLQYLKDLKPRYPALDPRFYSAVKPSCLCHVEVLS